MNEAIKSLPAVLPDKTIEHSRPVKPDPVTRLHDKAIEGLIRRVRGFMTSEKKITYERGAQGERIARGEVVTRKQVSPDLQAIIFTLSNLDPESWKAKPEVAAPQAGLNVSPEDEQAAAMGSDALRLLAGKYPQQ